MSIRAIIQKALRAIIKALDDTPAPIPVKVAPVKRTHRWSNTARKNLKARTPEAPYGLKKDGTPRAKPGAPKKVVA